jgi:two-component system, OmpR family, sensor kinase
VNRAFISLYFFIVFSVIVIGWGLDKFWEKLYPAPDLEADVADLIILLEQDLVPLSAEQQQARIEQHNQHLHNQLQLIHIDDLANSSATQQIRAGEVVSASADADRLIWYKRITDTDQVLVMVSPNSDQTRSPVYSGLLIIFYLGIALVVFLWVWPLSRDLSRLEKHTRLVGKDGAPDQIAVAPTSTVFTLANAFNRMAKRIRELINSHKEMTYAVSHELRTPLARMKFALAMVDNHDDAKVQKQLDSIHQDVMEMENLISALLSYAGFEQESQQLDRRDGFMHDLLNELCTRIYRDRPDAVAIHIRDESGGQAFNCEWKLMECVILNLLQNAARFAREKIQVELRITDTEFQVAIEDDGPGIPPEERARVFESFVRLYNEHKPQPSGFGLGLAIVKRIMKWHGGDATFVDARSGGARILLYWPKQPTPTFPS